MVVKGTGAAAATTAGLKGGIIVKIGLGIAAAGLVAGTAFMAVGGRSEEGAKPNASSAADKPTPAFETKSKFGTPIWDPSVRFEVIQLAGVSAAPVQQAGSSMITSVARNTRPTSASFLLLELIFAAAKAAHPRASCADSRVPPEAGAERCSARALLASWLTERGS